MSHPVAFLDESGDPGRSLQRGASPLFLVTLTVFADTDVASTCRTRIEALRHELHKSERFEFHFRTNSHVERIAFLQAIQPFAFTYHAIILDKVGLEQPGTSSIYLNAVAQVCAAAGRTLDRALLVVDGNTENRRARRLLESAIRQRVNGEQDRIAVATVRVQDSRRNDLLQLADYVTGVTSWSAQGKLGADRYREFIQHREGASWRGQA